MPREVVQDWFGRGVYLVEHEVVEELVRCRGAVHVNPLHELQRVIGESVDDRQTQLTIHVMRVATLALRVRFRARRVVRVT